MNTIHHADRAAHMHTNLSRAPWTVTGKKGLKGEKHFKSQQSPMQRVCVCVCAWDHVRESLCLSIQVSICCVVLKCKWFLLIWPLCVCVCVRAGRCSPLCSCDPGDSGWAVTRLICPGGNTAWKMSSEHSEFCLHSLQVASLLIWQVIITRAPLPLPSRSRKHTNKGGGGRRRQNKGITFLSQTGNRALNSQVVQKAEIGGLLWLFIHLQRLF